MSSQNPEQWQQQPGSTLRSGKPALTVDAVIPEEQTAQQVVQEFIRDQAMSEVTYRREQDGTAHVRIQLRAGAVSQFRNRLQKLAESVERSYQTTGM